MEIWGPETFFAPSDWRARARVLTDEGVPGVRLVVPHPHDILVSKIERWEAADQEHARAIVEQLPLRVDAFDRLVARAPYRDGRIHAAERIARFEAHVAAFRSSCLPGTAPRPAAD